MDARIPQAHGAHKFCMHDKHVLWHWKVRATSENEREREREAAPGDLVTSWPCGHLLGLGHLRVAPR